MSETLLSTDQFAYFGPIEKLMATSCEVFLARVFVTSWRRCLFNIYVVNLIYSANRLIICSRLFHCRMPNQSVTLFAREGGTVWKTDDKAIIHCIESWFISQYDGTIRSCRSQEGDYEWWRSCSVFSTGSVSATLHSDSKNVPFPSASENCYLIPFCVRSLMVFRRFMIFTWVSLT